MPEGKHPLQEADIGEPSPCWSERGVGIAIATIGILDTNPPSFSSSSEWADSSNTKKDWEEITARNICTAMEDGKQAVME